MVRTFYPRSPHGERRSSIALGSFVLQAFYPRSPHGERRVGVQRVAHARLSFYPRSPHGERLIAFVNSVASGNLSIHALRMESDVWGTNASGRIRILSIHALRMESDDALGITANIPIAFYPRSPHGERR